jgi:uncharacterized protein
MIVVSNTSPLTNLAAVGCFNLLSTLFGQVHVATGVVAELSAGGHEWPGATETRQADWIRVVQVGNTSLVDALRLDLDRGEAETIALALELGADLVLLDEQAGRFAAQYFNLSVMGVVGLLVGAKSKKLVPEVQPLLDALRWQAGFYLSEAVYRHALALAGE